jgi:hypothetical protein
VRHVRKISRCRASSASSCLIFASTLAPRLSSCDVRREGRRVGGSGEARRVRRSGRGTRMKKRGRARRRSRLRTVLASTTWRKTSSFRARRSRRSRGRSRACARRETHRARRVLQRRRGRLFFLHPEEAFHGARATGAGRSETRESCGRGRNVEAALQTGDFTKIARPFSRFVKRTNRRRLRFLRTGVSSPDLLLRLFL